jgi:hypothetical protein
VDRFIPHPFDSRRNDYLIPNVGPSRAGEGGTEPVQGTRDKGQGTRDKGQDPVTAGRSTPVVRPTVLQPKLNPMV